MHGGDCVTVALSRTARRVSVGWCVDRTGNGGTGVGGAHRRHRMHVDDGLAAAAV